MFSPLFFVHALIIVGVNAPIDDGLIEHLDVQAGAYGAAVLVDKVARSVDEG